MAHRRVKRFLNFDIDHYINPFVPPSPLYLLPPSISRWVGYRESPQEEPPTLIQWALSFIAIVAGLCLIGGLYNTAPGIQNWRPPVMIASLGASAVLDYNTIRSPLAQPRNAILGHTIAALVGVCVTKLFQLNPYLFHTYQWLPGTIACACANLAMSVTNTVHPPGGATAILASTDPEIIRLSWIFVPFILLASTLMVVVACLLNNTLRQYPLYWWTPGDVGHKLRTARREEKLEAILREGNEKILEKQESNTDSTEDQVVSNMHLSGNIELAANLGGIHILPHQIQLPRHVGVTPEEVSLLERLQSRLRNDP
ncbi:hypothetical protein M433DRAFT_149411 [Acidomyces richmondensis BFW]|nr:MAG: hypothetical protein FE78DRAFT_89532 [Acidomyces sp. 'richmondensis']KYG49960.1 hypothetical protein M433DRAFT_149411 [Acidomyces richmondensis BFW]